MSRFLPIASLVVPANRQRREFDFGELNELRESIERLGMFHAIVVREDADSGCSVLVAGERRLRAITTLWDMGGSFQYDGEAVPVGCIPVSSLADLSPLEAMEAEYEENARRSDLTWQEKAKATANLAALRKAQAEAAGLPPPTTLEIAREILGPDRKYQVTTRNEMLVARHLDDPDVAKAANVQDAFKVLKRKEGAKKAAELGASLGGEIVAERHQLVRANCLEWLATCPDGTFDVVLTDPPYGMGADEFGDSGGKAAGEHLYRDDAATVRNLIDQLPSLLFSITRPDAHCYLFCDIYWFSSWKSEMEAAGWKVFRTPLIWHKPSAYRAPWPRQGPQRKYELILYAVKGGLEVTKLVGDVLTYQPDTNLGHQAQKPVDLFADLLKRSCLPGMRVLDAFCGSGPIFPAAQECKVFATGIEEDEVAYGLAAARLQQLKGLV